MVRCPACGGDAQDGSRYCPACARPLAELTSALTETSAESRTPGASLGSVSPAHGVSLDSLSRARFLPGAMLAARYRIVGLLGRGGMGEVYRADDIKLGQAVALKFLPATVERDAARLQRFLNEVKIARQISHPNVCRVYDVGDEEGHHFLSMEYVDGEDLASLLRRIGRLPRDKAVQISRQLCAGLAAAHEQGVLHRDLKPANVMIDGRGRAKITDFGLATLAGTVRADEVGAGTPLYMAPEQRAGKDVSVRSDLYSLGLVLYELFTGQPAFKASTPAELARLQAVSTPTSPGRLVEGFDPTVERAILRCLEKEPRDRPASALAVAASLPGGDPLAAALAAGETPSPEVVAAAGEEGTLRPSIAWACLASLAVGLALVLWLSPRTQVVEAVGLDKSPEILAERAREIVRKLGYPEAPLHEAWGLESNWDLLRHVEDTNPTNDRWKDLARSRPSGILFWYRASPRYMVPSSGAFANASIQFSDPPLDVTGMTRIFLDPQGRLLGFERMPPERDLSKSPFPEPDWPALLGEADLSSANLQPTQPAWNPPFGWDARGAWDWTSDDNPLGTVRVEAAAWHGKPVFFALRLPWETPGRDEAARPATGDKIGQYLVVSVVALLLLGGGFLARRNLRLGRGDRRGTIRLAVFAIAFAMAGWLLRVRHVPDMNLELALFSTGLGTAVLGAVLLAMLYLALEPFARRTWPQILISWNRLLAGRFRDPLVGRDLMVGCLLGAFQKLMWTVSWDVDRLLGYPPPRPFSAFDGLNGARDVMATIAGGLGVGVGSVVIALFLLVLFRMLLRRRWAAAVGVVLLLSAQNVLNASRASSPGVLTVLLGTIAFVAVLVRFGVLAALAGSVVGNLLLAVPWPSSLSVWYAVPALAVLAAIAAIAIFGFRCALGGRPAFGQALDQE